MLVVEVVDIEVNNSVGVVDKGMHDIVAVRIDQIDRLVDHTLVDEEVDKIDSVEPHLMTPYMMDLYCNLIINKYKFTKCFSPIVTCTLCWLLTILTRWFVSLILWVTRSKLRILRRSR